ncbi:MAG: hypothetical protein AAF404_21345 [Pseudomonadota bacterium]
MFEQYAEWFWLALFVAVILYGLSNTISVPLRVKRFYASLGFTDGGVNAFETAPYVESLLLQGLTTNHHYSGEYEGIRIEQFAAISKQRRQFTLNKVIRKRNQQVWTVTVVLLNSSVTGFCARPIRVPEAPEYMFNGDAVLFPDDDAFSSRVHVVATDHAQARKVISAEIREYLDGIDPLSLESVQSVLIHRRTRQPHDTGAQLQKDLDAMVRLAGLVQQV